MEKLIETLNTMNKNEMNCYYKMMDLINKTLRIKCTVEQAEKLHSSDPWAFASKKYSITFNGYLDTYTVRENRF